MLYHLFLNLIKKRTFFLDYLVIQLIQKAKVKMVDDEGETSRQDHPYSSEKIHAVLDRFIGYLSSLVIVQWVIVIF